MPTPVANATLPEDQLPDLGVDGWPTGTAMRLGLLLGDEPAVPTEEGLWAD